MLKAWIRTAALALAALAMPSMLAAAEPVGRVLSIEGAPQVERSSNMLELRKNDPLFIGDIVRTGSGRAKIMFEDQSLMTLDRNTDLKITNYLFQKKQQKREGMLDLLQGRVKALVGQFFSSREDFRVRTPTAVAGVRGTHFLVEVNGADESNVTVFSGAVAVVDGAGNEQLLEAGMRIGVAGSGFLSAPQKLAAEVLRRLEREIEVRDEKTLQQQGGSGIDVGELGGDRGDTRGAGSMPTDDDDEVELPSDDGAAVPAAPPINLESVDPASLGELRMRLRPQEVK